MKILIRDGDCKGQSKDEVFEEFVKEDREAVAERRQARFEARNQSDSESDISVSSVSTDDLSDATDSEEEDEEEERWNVNPDPVVVSLFSAATDPTSGIAEDRTAIDFFYLIFPKELIEHVAVRTNHYAQECIATKPYPKWFETTLDEMKAFFGLHVHYGIKQLPATRLYWSKDPLIGIPAVQKVMSRNHFDQLSKYLHLNNANQVPQEDPAHISYSKYGWFLIVLWNVVRWNCNLKKICL